MEYQMSEISTYLNKATILLKEYQWIYNFNATHLLVDGVFSVIPDIWIEILLHLSDEDILLITAGVIKDEWASILVDFVKRCHQLTLPSSSMDFINSTKNWNYIPGILRKGMSPKKQHEVLHLASFIHDQCNHNSLFRVLDLGSGLGYLGKFLHHQSGYRILGLETNAGHVGRALKMQQSICTSGVHYMAFTLNPAHRKEDWEKTVHDVKSALEKQDNWGQACSCGQSKADLESGSQENLENGEMNGLSEKCAGMRVSEQSLRICMVSLHSCGDLSPTALRLFLKLPETKVLILLSCCYHKMKSLHSTDSSAGNSDSLVVTEDICGDVGDSRRKMNSNFVGKRNEIDEAARSSPKVERKIGKLDHKYPNDCGGETSSSLQTTHKSAYNSKPSISKKEKHNSHGKNKLLMANEDRFPDFPMSTKLKNLISTQNYFIRRPLLRLASEITVEMWRHMTAEQHYEHAVHVMGRAVLQLYAKICGFRLKKKHRRGVRKCSNFEDYFADAVERFEFFSDSEGENLVEVQSDDFGKITNSSSRGCPNLSVSCPPKNSCPPEAFEGVASSINKNKKHQRKSNREFHEDVLNRRGEEELQDVSKVTKNTDECDKPENSVPFSSYRNFVYPLSVADDIPFVDDDDDILDRECIESRNVGKDPVLNHEYGTKDSRSTVPNEIHRQRLTQIARDHCTKSNVRITKALYALQATIQSVAEGYILADRLEFLHEKGGDNIESSIVRIFDRNLSPRSYAIVARKKDFDAAAGE